MAGRASCFHVVFHPVTWLNESVVGIKPGDSHVGIGYLVDEFTHTWSAEHFVA